MSIRPKTNASAAYSRQIAWITAVKTVK